MKAPLYFTSAEGQNGLMGLLLDLTRVPPGCEPVDPWLIRDKKGKNDLFGKDCLVAAACEWT